MKNSSLAAVIWLPPGSKVDTICKWNRNGFVWDRCDLFTITNSYLMPSDSTFDFKENLTALKT